MEWTDSELNVIRDSYWKTRIAQCPKGHDLEVIDNFILGNEKREIVAKCHQCEMGYTIAPDTDPISDTFRSWTDDERIQLVENAQGDIVCPVDGSWLNVSEKAVGGEVAVGKKALEIRCGRCGQALHKRL